jgi:hypothetical protein
MLVEQNLVDMPSESLAGERRMVLLIGWLPILGMRTGVTWDISRFSEEVTSAELRAAL